LFAEGNSSLIICAPLSQQVLLAVMAAVYLTVAILNGLALFKTARSLAPISHLPTDLTKACQIRMNLNVLVSFLADKKK
jgi:hypothetical protein